MKPVCRLIGHRLDVDASRFYGIDYCTRCDEEFVGQPLHIERAKVRVAIAREWVSDQVLRVTGFFQRCPDCGKRWGQHDNSQDHLPF